jgi:hypothetical protein
MVSDHESAERIERLQLAADRKAPAFQSVLAVVVSDLESVREAERGVVGAAISLAHREKVGAMLEETESALSALHRLAVRPLGVTEPESNEDARGSWWYTLADATHTLEAGIDRISSLVGSQPRRSGVRDLASAAVRLMRSHHRLLLDEAGRWIEG